MRTVNDLMEIADLFRSDAIGIVEQHCVAVRNRNSSCRHCVDACPVQAITVSANRLHVDLRACVSCGSCIAVCPTSALEGLDPTDEDILTKVTSAAARSGGMAVITCARMEARQVGDPDKYTALSCLGRLSESLLVSLVAHDIDDIVIVDGTCKTCKYRTVDPFINDTIENTIGLLEMRGLNVVITRCSEFPSEVLISDDVRAIGAARRGLFTQTGGYARNVAVNAANRFMERTFNQGQQKDKSSNLRGQLNMSKTGKMPVFQAERNMCLLDDLYRMGEIAQPEFTSRLFGVMDIDVFRCTGCGMCVMFCPTGAIKYASYDEPDDETMRYLEFQVADCTQCNLCVDVCMHHCVEVSSIIPTEELFDFEPRLIEIPRPAKSQHMGNRPR